MDILTFHMLRHGPVFNPNQLWYGREIEFDLTSEPVLQHFNRLAGILPSDAGTSLWLSSDYPRALDFAKAVRKRVPQENVAPLVIDKHFIEQQYGIMEGMAGRVAKDDPRLTPYFTDMWKNAPPEGESMEMLQARVGGRLDYYAETLSRNVSHVVVFAHGGVNMAAFAHVRKQRMIDVFTSRKDPLTPSFSYASRLELQFDRDQGKWLEGTEYDTGLPKNYLEMKIDKR